MKGFMILKPPSSSAVGQASNSTCLCRNPTHVWIPNAVGVSSYYEIALQVLHHGPDAESG